MAAAPRKTIKPAVVDVDGEAPLSRFAQLCDEATADYEPKPDYLFDGTEPPTPIKEPVTAEQITAFAELIDQQGAVEPSRLRDLIAAVCGDAFDAVWAVVGKKHINVLLAVIGDINDHFNAVPAEDGADLPGGV